jgi:tRNA-dihydrouridine synthase B
VAKIGNIDVGEFPLLLAPMEDVSDPPFRALCKEQGADVVFTEFISSEGLIRDAAKSVMKLDIYEKERPVGIQIFGANLDSMLESVEIVEKSGPDMIDINFGCPVKKGSFQGCRSRYSERYRSYGFPYRRYGETHPSSHYYKDETGLG